VDHHEQHHQQHRKEREEKKKEQKDYEQEKSLLPFHPAWLFVAGIILTGLALLVWTLFL